MDFSLDNCFLSTIWPTNEENVEQIINIIKSYKYRVCNVFRYEFSINWDKMIRVIYKDDRVKEKNLVNKIKTMSDYPNFLYLSYIYVEDPSYRIKKDGRRISTSMEKLKKSLRSVFGHKLSRNNPIHIVDEQMHTINLHNNLERYGKFIEDVRFK